MAVGKSDLSSCREKVMNQRPSLFSWHFAGAVILLGVTLMASKLTAARKPQQLAQPLDTIDRSIAGFSGTDGPPLTEGVLSKLLCDSYLSRLYTNANTQADLFIAYYAEQRAGESMHSPKHCLPGAGWEIWDYASAQIPVRDRSFNVNKYSISKDNQRMLVLYWYQSKNRIVASEYLGKLQLARDTLLHNSTAGSIVRIIVPDQPGALQHARDLASGVIPEMDRCFGDGLLSVSRNN
jgi:EpsI family protein